MRRGAVTVRVVIATDRYPGLTSAQAGAAIGSAWAARRAQVAVVPIGCAGDGLDQALADLWGAATSLISLGDDTAVLVSTLDPVSDTDPSRWLIQLQPRNDEGPPWQGSSAVIADALLAALDAHHAVAPSLLVLDIARAGWLDGGRGFLAAIGGVERVRSLFPHTEWVLATSADDVGAHLSGLRGITSRTAHAQTATGAAPMEVAEMLSRDQTLVDLATESGAAAGVQLNGSGAGGGLGWIIQCLAGRVTTGPALCRELSGLDQTLAQADLVVTGGACLDFGTMGGDVLSELRQAAEAALVPCVVIAGENFISPRELRSIGVEAAYPVRRRCVDEADVDAVAITADELTAVADQVAASWAW